MFREGLDTVQIRLKKRVGFSVERVWNVLRLVLEAHEIGLNTFSIGFR